MTAVVLDAVGQAVALSSNLTMKLIARKDLWLKERVLFVLLACAMKRRRSAGSC